MLEYTDEGRVIYPSFPHLQGQIRAAQMEVDWINTEILPAVKGRLSAIEENIPCKYILMAAQNESFFPGLSKRSLSFERFIFYNGKKVYFDHDKFMAYYDLTKEGKDRLQTLEEFEALPDNIKQLSIIQR